MVSLTGGSLSGGSSGGGGGGSSGAYAQVVSTNLTTATTVAGTNGVFNDTGLTVDITPASTDSDVEITFSLTHGGGAAGYQPMLRLIRESTHIGAGAAASSRTLITCAGTETNAAGITTTTFTMVDSPSTASEITYKVQIGQIGTGSSITFGINRSVTDTDSAVYARASSTITVKEIS